MIGAEGQCTPKLPLPLPGCLFGPCINQVNIDAAEMLLRDCERIKALRNRMRAPQKGQGCVIERLKAKRHAVYPSFRQVGEAGCLNRGRVRLKCNLDIVGKAPMLRSGFNQLEPRKISLTTTFTF